MSQVEYLDLEDLLGMVRALEAGPVRDVGLLDSAAARQRSSPFGQEAYPTLALQAAALLQSLARNHALVDENKRLAWLATVVFLDLNSHTTRPSHDEAFDLVMDVSKGVVDVDEIATRLRILG